MRIQCQYDVGQYVKFKCGGNTLFGTIHMIVVTLMDVVDMYLMGKEDDKYCEMPV